MSGNAVRLQAINDVEAYVPPADQLRPRRGARRDLRRERLHARPVMQKRLPKSVFKSVMATIEHSAPLDPAVADVVAVGHEGLGDGEGRDPLRARLLPADRADRREARQLPRAGRRRLGARRVRRQDPDPGRAGRVQLPQRRPAQHVRGPRLHRLGRHQPGVHPREPERQHAVHPDGLRVDDRRGARPQDAAAALAAGDGRAGRARPEAVRPRGPRRRRVVRRRRAGVLPDRPALLPRPPRPAQLRPHAVRRQAAEGPGVRRPLLRRHPRAGARPSCWTPSASCSSSASRPRPGTTRSRPASSRSRRCSSGPTSPPTTSSC